MNDKQLNHLISESLKTDEDFFPEITEMHTFSGKFNRNMKYLLREHETPIIHTRNRHALKWWFVAIAVFLTVSACSLTAYGSKTNHIHFFADKFSEYQPLEEMEEDAPANAKLAYDLDALTEKYDNGVEIVNGEQYTRFFVNPETNTFFEFSSYPKIFFRWHSSIENPEIITLGDKKITYFTDKNQIHYALWSASSTVFVVRSDMSREQMLQEIDLIQIYEIV
ncbi:MAG: hypothetical protein IJJ69_09320 [Oscillospiraceae bacterium]|nr:hypothetical protein [Oscillospiraceae bacterium]